MTLIDARNSPELKQALSRLPEPPQSLQNYLEAVGGRRKLSATPAALKRAELVIGQAIQLIAGVYVHLPTMRALYAVNPVARLKLLKHQLPELSELSFHLQMIDIFRELRDRMVRYIAPTPYQSANAFLPFQLGAFWRRKKRRFLVTKTLSGFEQEGFGRGVEVTRWNGMPVEWVALDHAEREPASNDAARFAFGLRSMTVRELTRHPPPEEAWVSVTYRPSGAAGREEREILLPWLVAAADPSSAFQEAPRPRRRSSKVFQPFQVKIIQRKTPIGYLRIHRFREAGAFIPEFERILDHMNEAAPRALIIDLRGNPGGQVDAAEKTLQFLTPRPIEPMLEQILNSPVTRQITQIREDWKQRWGGVILEETGAVFSAGSPSIPADALNTHGQRYYGRVLLIVDASTAGAAEILAGSFQDHQAGLILGVDPSTAGAVGDIEDQVTLARMGIDGFAPLPDKTRMFVPAQRAIRVGLHSGDLLDDDGVKPDVIHQLTRRDLMEDDVDLMRKACSLLARSPLCTLKATVEEAAGALEVSCVTQGLVRLEFHINGRFQTAVSTRRRSSTIKVPVSLHGFDTQDEETPEILEIQGYVHTAAGAKEDTGLCLRAARKISRGSPEWRVSRAAAYSFRAAAAGGTPSPTSP